MNRSLTKGWVYIKGTWHYFRGKHTLCGRSVNDDHIGRTLGMRLREMENVGVNCKGCERKRLAETGARTNG